MSGDHPKIEPQSFTVPLALYATPRSGDYFQIPLPDDIERYGWTVAETLSNRRVECKHCGREFANPRAASNHLQDAHGLSGGGLTEKNTVPVTRNGESLSKPDESTIIYLSSETEVVDNRSISYLCGRTDRVTRHGMTLRQCELNADYNRLKYGIALPSEFVGESDNALFSDIVVGDTVHVELDQEDNEIRVYSQEQYQVKLLNTQTVPEFVSPAAWPAIPYIQRDGFVDIAAATEFTGDRFEIVFFDSMHRYFATEAIERGYILSKEMYERSEFIREEKTVVWGEKIFEVVKDKYNIPKMSTKFSIGWEYEPIMSGYTDFPSVYQHKYASDSIKVVLPREGSFHVFPGIRNKVSNWSSSCALTTDSSKRWGNLQVNEYWKAASYCESMENGDRIYSPARLANERVALDRYDFNLLSVMQDEEEYLREHEGRTEPREDKVVISKWIESLH